MHTGPTGGRSSSRTAPGAITAGSFSRLAFLRQSCGHPSFASEPGGQLRFIPHSPHSSLLTSHLRFRWSDSNIPLFPKTTQIVKDAAVPSVEVFFARQVRLWAPPGPNPGQAG